MGPPVDQTPRINIIFITLFAIVVIYLFARQRTRRHRDKFASHRAQEIYQSSRDLFDRTSGMATYSEYKTALSDVDPVLYTDVRRLWKEGRLTPEGVNSVM